MKSPKASDSQFTKVNVPSQINTASITHANTMLYSGRTNYKFN